MDPLIYVVDDDHDEHYILQNVFSDHHGDCTVRCFADGTELVTRLTHMIDGRLPDLILLDLNMPVLTGFEILELLKTDADWKSIPIVVRTTSETFKDINRCYDLGTDAFIIKSTNYQQLAESVKSLQFNLLD